jgi:hypothetical protein
LCAGLPIAVFVLHASVFGSWIVDDAGISFAYARSLATGHGLVSQPGMPPVEGYTNFLWVLVMAAFFRVGLFHVVWTPKVVAAALTAGSFLLVTDTMKRLASWGFWVPVGALVLLGIQPAFVIWSMSGLENPLYVFLSCLLLATVVRWCADTAPARLHVVAMGVVSAAVVATRPDGILYIPLVVLILLARAAVSRIRGAWWIACGLYVLTAATLLAGQVAFRWWYFNDVFPNTYYMKGVGGMASVGSVLWLAPDVFSKIKDLAEAVAGDRAAMWYLICVFGGTLFLIGRRQFSEPLMILAAFSMIAALSYLLLPLDWMGEFRFATPFFLFCYAYVTALLWTFCELAVRDATLRGTSSRSRWACASC